jgi:hypothetical protein
MRPETAALFFLVTLALPSIGRAGGPTADSSARTAIQEALSEKADLPLLRPSLPSFLAERNLDPSSTRADGEARGEAEKSAGSEQSKAHGAAARGEAASAAAGADADEHGAADQARVKKAKKDHTKPTPPPHPVH